MATEPKQSIQQLIRECLRIEGIVHNISLYLDYASLSVMKVIYVNLCGNLAMEKYDETGGNAKVELRQWASAVSFMDERDFENGDPDDKLENVDVLERTLLSMKSPFLFSKRCKVLYWNSILSDVPCGLKWFSNLKVLRFVKKVNILYKRDRPVIARLPADLALCASLEQLSFDGLNFRAFPDNKFFTMNNLKSLTIKDNTVIEELPDWIGFANKKLTEVSIIGCTKLLRMPLSLLQVLDRSVLTRNHVCRVMEALNYDVPEPVPNITETVQIDDILELFEVTDQEQLYEEHHFLHIMPRGELYRQVTEAIRDGYPNLHLLQQSGLL